MEISAMLMKSAERIGALKGIVGACKWDLQNFQVALEGLEDKDVKDLADYYLKKVLRSLNEILQENKEVK